MPIEIRKKEVTKPTTVTHHKNLVPLRVVSFGSKRYSTSVVEKTDLDEFGCEIGDILFTVPTGWGQTIVVNATRGRSLTHADNYDKIFVVRAYEISQIILTNDNDPAPVL